MGECSHVVPIKQEVPCIQCVEELEAKISELEKALAMEKLNYAGAMIDLRHFEPAYLQIRDAAQVVKDELKMQISYDAPVSASCARRCIEALAKALEGDNDE